MYYDYVEDSRRISDQNKKRVTLYVDVNHVFVFNWSEGTVIYASTSVPSKENKIKYIICHPTLWYGQLLTYIVTENLMLRCHLRMPF